MDQKPLGGNTQDYELNSLGRLAATFLEYGHNATNNISKTYDEMTLQSWIRLIVIIGGYMLMRPYFMKFAAQGALKKLEEEDRKEQAKISPNELRGVQQQLEAQHEEDQLGECESADWGQKARVRQRVILKQMIDEEEQRRQDEEDDKDIQEFLED